MQVIRMYIVVKMALRKGYIHSQRVVILTLWPTYTYVYTYAYYKTHAQKTQTPENWLSFACLCINWHSIKTIRPTEKHLITHHKILVQMISYVVKSQQDADQLQSKNWVSKGKDSSFYLLFLLQAIG